MAGLQSASASAVCQRANAPAFTAALHAGGVTLCVCVCVCVCVCMHAGGVTSGLKKVSKEEMTHKNPQLRASSVVPAKASGVSKKELKKSSQKMQKKKVDARGVSRPRHALVERETGASSALLPAFSPVLRGGTQENRRFSSESLGGVVGLMVYFSSAHPPLRS